MNGSFTRKQAKQTKQWKILGAKRVRVSIQADLFRLLFPKISVRGCDDLPVKTPNMLPTSSFVCKASFLHQLTPLA